MSRGVTRILVPWAEIKNRLQLLVDRERGAFALQSTGPDNLDNSFEWHAQLDLRDIFYTLGFALPSETKRIYGKCGKDHETGNKIVEFLLSDYFSREKK